ncbi:MAG: PAS domain-containing protein [Bacteroidota bacterium]|nr:PAS domain-containing protein [Kiloniellaceae bacterium]
MKFEERFHNEPLHLLYKYWSSLRGAASIPSRGDIAPDRILEVLPHIGLFDVETAPRRYRIRLMGTEIVRWYGCDLSGRYLDEIDFGHGPQFTFALLDQVVDRRQAGHMSGEYTKQDGRTIRYERLFMPLASDGRHVDMVIGAAYELPPEAPLRGDCLEGAPVASAIPLTPAEG